MVYLFAAALVQIMHGNYLEYTATQIGFYDSWLVGSWIMTKFKDSIKIMKAVIPLYFSVFLFIFIHNPWLVSLSVTSVGFADSIHSILWLKIMKSASEKLFGSVMGIDNLVTDSLRLGYDTVAGYLYSIDFLAVPILGIITITLVSFSYAVSKSWRIKIQ